VPAYEVGRGVGTASHHGGFTKGNCIASSLALDYGANRRRVRRVNSGICNLLGFSRFIILDIPSQSRLRLKVDVHFLDDRAVFDYLHLHPVAKRVRLVN